MYLLISRFVSKFKTEVMKKGYRQVITGDIKEVGTYVGIFFNSLIIAKVPTLIIINNYANEIIYITYR